MEHGETMGSRSARVGLEMFAHARLASKFATYKLTKEKVKADAEIVSKQRTS